MRWIGARSTALALALFVPAPAPADDAAIERGRALVSASCFLCHGMQGETTSELYPRLAAQHPRYLEKQLRNFRDGRRAGGGMEAQAARLSDEDIAAIAAYLSRQRLDPLPVKNPAVVDRGRSIYETGKPAVNLKACASCHGTDAGGRDLLPRLAGQQPAYVIEQLNNFRRPWRRSGTEAMHEVAGKLSDADIAALAEYVAQLP